MKKAVLFVLIILTLLSCDRGGTQVLKSGKTLYIGVLLPVEQVLNHKATNALKVLAQSQGLLENGDSLSLEFEYVKSNPEKSFISLCQKQDLVAIISFLNSTQTLGLKELMEARKIPVISTIATHSKVTKTKYISKICINNKMQAHVAASYLRDELFISKVSVLSTKNDAFSLELSAFFIKRYERLGGEVKAQLDTQMMINKPQIFIQNLKDNKTKTLYMSIDAENTRHLLKLLEKEKITLTILAHDGLLSEFMAIFPKDIKLLNGIFVIDNYADDIVLSDKANSFANEMQNQFSTLDSYDLLSFDAWSLLKKGLNACSTEEKECLNQYMRHCKSFEGAVESIRMENASAYRAAYVNEIKNSKMRVKVKVY